MDGLNDKFDYNQVIWPGIGIDGMLLSVDNCWINIARNEVQLDPFYQNQSLVTSIKLKNFDLQQSYNAISFRI